MISLFCFHVFFAVYRSLFYREIAHVLFQKNLNIRVRIGIRGALVIHNGSQISVYIGQRVVHKTDPGDT